MNGAMFDVVFSGPGDEVGDAVFYALTGAAGGVGVTEVTIAMTVFGDGVKVVPAIQYSDDGETWDTAVAATGVEPAEPDGTTTYKPLAVPGGFSGASEKLLVRFGGLVYNASSGDDGKSLCAQVRMEVVVTPKEAGTVTGGPFASPSSGATGSGDDGVATWLTPWMKSAPMDQVRVSWEMASRVGDAESVVVYQTSEDGITLGAVKAFAGTARTSNGVTYGTSFSSPGSANTEWQAARLVRWGSLVRNTSGTVIGGCVSTLRIDWRRG